MQKQALIKIGLTEEHADKVMAAYDDAIKGYEPVAKLAQAQAETAKLAEQLKERDTQLDTLKKEAATADVAGGDLASKARSLEKRLDEAIAENKANTEKAAAEFAQYKLNSAVDLALTKEGARNIKAAKALLDMGMIKLDGDSVLGLTEQLTKLKTSDGYMFASGNDGGTTPPGTPGITGREPYPGARTSGEDAKPNPFAKATFNLTEQGRLRREDPDSYAKLKAAASVANTTAAAQA